MANYSTRTDVIVQVNGRQAQDMLQNLRTRASQLRTEMDRVAGSGDKRRWQSLRTDLRRVEQQMQFITQSTRTATETLTRLNSASPRELNRALRMLTRQLDGIPRGTEAWRRQVEQIRAVREQISRVRSEMQPVEGMWERMRSGIGGFATGAVAGAASAAGLTSAVHNAVEAFTAMDQEMANVRKFTGMTTEEVETLNAEFLKIDTRTSREGLNRLAQEAGRLGKTSVEDVLGFVRAADQINVALDELGDGATLTLSKLTGIFGDEERLGTEKALLSVGSVINDLSQICSASAPYLAEFASRMGGVGAQAGMTISQIMAFGAVLDTQKLNVEAASTALQQVVVKLLRDPAKYARVAGLEVKQFAELCRTDMNSALIQLLDTLGKSGGMSKLAPMFADMGENGSRSIATLSALAGHIDEVKTQQIAANQAFSDATSVTNEFSVQNTTAAAEVDKARNRLHELTVELGEKLYPAYQRLLDTTTATLSFLASAASVLWRHREIVLSLAAGVGVYTLAVNKSAIATAVAAAETKLLTAAHTLGRSATLLAAAAKGVLTGNTVRATAAMKMFNSTVKLNPLGLFMGLLTAASAMLVTFRSRTNKAAEAQKALNSIKADAVKSMESEKSKVEMLIAAAADETLAMEDRLRAVGELNKIIPGYNAQIDQTTGKYTASATALEEYNRQLARKYELEGAKTMLADIGRQTALLNMQKAEADKELADQRSRAAAASTGHAPRISSGGQPSGQYFETMNAAAATSALERKISSIDDQLSALDAKREAVMGEYGEDLKKEAITTTTTPEDPESEPESGTGTPASPTDKDAARRRAVMERKEFKAALDSIKADRERAEAEALVLRSNGEIDYREYQQRKLDAEADYFKRSLKLYEDHELQEDEKYAALLKKREEANARAAQTRINLNREVIRREQDMEIAEARYRFNLSAQTADDQRVLNEQIYRIKLDGLSRQMELYDKGSKEYADLEAEEQKLIADYVYERRVELEKRVRDLRQEYARKTPAELRDIELAALDQLYDQKLLKEEEYQAIRAAIRKKYAGADAVSPTAELPGGESGARKSVDDAGQQRAKALDQLHAALDAGEISLAEYQDRLRRVEADYRDAILAPLEANADPWVSGLTRMANAWADFADSIKSGDVPGAIAALGSAMEMTTVMMTAAFSQASEFIKAELEIQTKDIENRYDKEIERAEGNSYKVRQAEQKKEAELAKLKSDANRKMFAMQVAQAIAQTATNALNAYGSAAAIPVVGHILAPIAAAVAAASGAVQIAAIKKQAQASEAQGYAEGGFTRPGRKYEEAGVVHAGEWVAPQELVNSPVTRPVIDMLEYARRTNSVGSLTMADVSRTISAPAAMAARPASAATPTVVVQQSARETDSRLTETIERLSRRLDDPFITVNSVTGENGIDRARDEYNRLIRNKSPKSRRS